MATDKTHKFVLDLLREKREETEKRIRHQIQTHDSLERLRKRINEINRAIFALIKDGRN